jgi:Arc/MetJ-type ribon-helix-helix transcriptional regulator
MTIKVLQRNQTLEKRIIFRLPDSMYEQVKEAVKKGKAKTPSELVRAALKEFLSKES